MQRFTIIFFVLFSFCSICSKGQDLYSVTSSQLNIRKKPSPNSEAIGKLNKDDSVKVFQIVNGWGEINTADGEKGYVFMDYLQKAILTKKPKENVIEQKTETNSGDSNVTIIFVIIAIVILALLLSSRKKKKNIIPVPKPIKVSSSENTKPSISFNVSVTKTSDDSIIDVTGASQKINSPIQNTGFKKYETSVPLWKHQYVYSYSEINSASSEQIAFYNHFRTRFLNGEYLEIGENTNLL